MNIRFINISRDLYWDDRENLDMEVLAQSMKNYLYDVTVSTYKYSVLENDLDNAVKEIIDGSDVLFFSFDFSTDEDTVNLIFKISNKVKKYNKNILIFMTGERACLTYENILNECLAIDYIILCEAEKSGKQIHKLLTAKNGTQEYSGLALRGKGKVEKIQYIEHNPQKNYIAIRDGKMLESLQVAKIRTSRGCLGKCKFCVDIGYGKEWRGRDLDDVVDEIELIVNKYNIKQFNFLDNSIVDSSVRGKERLISLMDKINERQLKIYFNCLARADSFLNGKDSILIDKMCKNGLFNILIGFESGYQADLDRFNKMTKVSDNYKANEMFKKKGVNVMPGFIMFHPYSTIESLKANTEFLKNIGKSYWFLSYCSSLKAFEGVDLTDRIKEDHLFNESYNYKNTLSYEFINREIQSLAEVLSNARIYSNAIKVAVSIEDSMNMIAKINKNYCEWKNKDDFNKDIFSAAEELGQFVDIFFNKCLCMISEKWNEKYFNEILNELESQVGKIKVNNIIKTFIKSNISNRELNSIIIPKTVF